MCWMCDYPGRSAADFYAETRANILRDGWSVQYVESDRMPFAYTVGLTEHRLPELLVTGVSPHHAVDLLNRVALAAVGGTALSAGMQMRLDGGPLVEVVEVAQPDAHLYLACAFFGPSITAFQMVWADSQGRWPWVRDFDDGRGSQPVLGARAGCH